MGETMRLRCHKCGFEEDVPADLNSRELLSREGWLQMAGHYWCLDCAEAALRRLNALLEQVAKEESDA